MYGKAVSILTHRSTCLKRTRRCLACAHNVLRRHLASGLWGRKQTAEDADQSGGVTTADRVPPDICVDSPARREFVAPWSISPGVFKVLWPNRADEAQASPANFPLTRILGRGRSAGQAGSAAKKVLASELAAILAGTEHPQHPHVAGGLVVARIGVDTVQHPIAAGTGQFTYTRMIADRPEARMLPEPLDVGADRRQRAPSARS